MSSVQPRRLDRRFLGGESSRQGLRPVAVLILLGGSEDAVEESITPAGDGLFDTADLDDIYAEVLFHGAILHLLQFNRGHLEFRDLGYRVERWVGQDVGGGFREMEGHEIRHPAPAWCSFELWR